MKNLCAVLAMLLSLSMTAIPACAGNIPAITEASETMIASSTFDMLLAGGMFGSGVPSTLQFSSLVDSQTRSFTYSLLPGQEYLGQPISLTTTGTYAGGGQYNWTVGGNYGGEAFSGDGGGVWVGDPDFPATTTVTYKGQPYTGSGTVSYDGTDSHSTAKNFTFTGPDGRKYGPASGTDIFVGKDGNTPAHWEYNFHLDSNDAFKTGMIIDGSGTVPDGAFGSFTLKVTPVPEPSTLALLGTSALCIGGVLRRRLLPRS